MSVIDINKELLIALVEERPVLWDKSDDIYKDRNATRKAWNEVCLGLKEDFDTLGDPEKKYLVSISQNNLVNKLLMKVNGTILVYVVE
jgi:hypothetical protein